MKEKIIGSDESRLEEKMKFAEKVSNKVIETMIDEKCQIEDVGLVLDVVMKKINAKKGSKFSQLYLNHLMDDKMTVSFNE